MEVITDGKNEVVPPLAGLPYFLCCEVTVERRKARPTGTAERNKGNDLRETY